MSEAHFDLRGRGAVSWVDTKDQARSLLGRLGFLSGAHRRERLVDGEPTELVKETTRGILYQLTD